MDTWHDALGWEKWPPLLPHPIYSTNPLSFQITLGLVSSPTTTLADLSPALAFLDGHLQQVPLFFIPLQPVALGSHLNSEILLALSTGDFSSYFWAPPSSQSPSGWDPDE